MRPWLSIRASQCGGRTSSGGSVTLNVFRRGIEGRDGADVGPSWSSSVAVGEGQTGYPSLVW